MEIFFGTITRYAIRRGSFRSVRESTDAIGAFIDATTTAASHAPGPRTPTIF
jgi:hypothetical protein